MRIPYIRQNSGVSEGDDFVYFAGDLTNAYPRQPGEYKRWGFPIHPIYSQRDLSHLQRLIRHVLFVKGKYFVIYDDIEASKAATFTWLYHSHVKPGPLPAHNLWISNKAPTRQFKFLAVIFPYKESDATPSIESVAPSTVRVTYGTQSDIITFSPDRTRLADFSIEAAAIKSQSRP